MGTTEGPNASQASPNGPWKNSSLLRDAAACCFLLRHATALLGVRGKGVGSIDSKWSAVVELLFWRLHWCFANFGCMHLGMHGVRGYQHYWQLKIHPCCSMLWHAATPPPPKQNPIGSRCGMLLTVGACNARRGTPLGACMGRVMGFACVSFHFSHSLSFL